jgi:hypothetical protein
MQDDERCCGTGTCIIDAQGLCWCGQQWDGEKMCRPAFESAPRQTAPHNTDADSVGLGPDCKTAGALQSGGALE